MVLFDGATYRMWYTGLSSAASSSVIGYATSSDGVNWTKYPTPVLTPTPGTWDNRSIRMGWVIFDGGVFKMWYDSTSAAGIEGISYATSIDGISWTKYVGNPVVGGGRSAYSSAYPSVIEDGPLYKRWYSGQDARQNAGVGFAYSDDGLHWTKDTGSPVLNAAGNECVVLVGTIYLMYYGTFRGFEYSAATSPSVVPEFQANIGYFIVLIFLASILVMRGYHFRRK